MSTNPPIAARIPSANPRHLLTGSRPSPRAARDGARHHSIGRVVVQQLQLARDARGLAPLRAHTALDPSTVSRCDSASARFDAWIRSSSACTRVNKCTLSPVATKCASSAPSHAIESSVAASFVSACGRPCRHCTRREHTPRDRSTPSTRSPRAAPHAQSRNTHLTRRPLGRRRQRL